MSLSVSMLHSLVSTVTLSQYYRSTQSLTCHSVPVCSTVLHHQSHYISIIAVHSHWHVTQCLYAPQSCVNTVTTPQYGQVLFYSISLCTVPQQEPVTKWACFLAWSLDLWFTCSIQWSIKAYKAGIPVFFRSKPVIPSQTSLRIGTRLLCHPPFLITYKYNPTRLFFFQKFLSLQKNKQF